jgi:hypothetical protein
LMSGQPRGLLSLGPRRSVSHREFHVPRPGSGSSIQRSREGAYYASGGCRPTTQSPPSVIRRSARRWQRNLGSVAGPVDGGPGTQRAADRIRGARRLRDNHRRCKHAAWSRSPVADSLSRGVRTTAIGSVGTRPKRAGGTKKAITGFTDSPCPRTEISNPSPSSGESSELSVPERRRPICRLSKPLERCQHRLAVVHIARQAALTEGLTEIARHRRRARLNFRVSADF